MALSRFGTNTISIFLMLDYFSRAYFSALLVVVAYSACLFVVHVFSRRLQEGASSTLYLLA
jgi:hypothetical protein